MLVEPSFLRHKFGLEKKNNLPSDIAVLSVGVRMRVERPAGRPYRSRPTYKSNSLIGTGESESE